MQTIDEKKRIVLLDSFRCLAILFVIFFHYTYRWKPPHEIINFYPYKSWYGNVFKYGKYGVIFFFMISGFVISFTLESTETMGAFIKNRFIRLFPPLLLCTLITFFSIHFLDKEQLLPAYHDKKNFFPSLTLINPRLLNKIFNAHFHWLNGSYWSLWVEIQFYFISSVVYYTNRKKYFTNILLTSFILVISVTFLKLLFANKLHLPVYVPNHVKTEVLTLTNSFFNITNYIQFFAIGVVFHKLYKKHIIFDKTFILLVVLTVLTSFVKERNAAQFIIILMMYILFGLMIYKSEALNFLNNPLFIRIGVLSYTIYLIHEPIGVLVIKHFSSYLGRLDVLAPWILAVLLILFAELSYKSYEKNTYKLLKKLLFKNDAGKGKLQLAKNKQQL